MIKIKVGYIFWQLLFFYSGAAFTQVSFEPSNDSLLYQLKIAREDSNKVIALIRLSGRAMVDDDESNDDQGKNYCRQAISLSEKINYKWGMAKATNILGCFFDNERNYSEAVKYYFSAIKIYEEIGNKADLAVPYRNLAIVYQSMGNYSEALKNHLIALKLRKESGRDECVASSYSELGYYYYDLKNYKEALQYYFAALELHKKVGNTPNVTSTRVWIGSAYKNQSNYLEALKYFSMALQELEPDNNYERAECYKDLGIIFSKQAALLNVPAAKMKNKKALEFLYKGLFYAKRTIYHDMIRDVYAALGEVYNETGNYKKALQYTLLSSQMKDSILIDKNSYAKIAELNMQFDKERANALEKTRQEKLKAEKLRMNNLLLMGSVLVIITSVFFILYIRQRNQKKRAVEKAETIHKIVELEMQSLRSQLNPHFMFNSLNSIQTLILKEDAERSQSYLSRFAKLLRMLLENADKPFIPLQKEINFLELYLSLESLRVPDLQYSISADPELDQEQTLIPNMFLQPYVENAIWHGLSYKEVDKQLQIRIYRTNGTVIYEIEDNGVGRKKAEELKSLFRKQHQSKGMELLNKRIKLLNTEYSSEILTVVTDVMKDHKIVGTLVTIKVPEMYAEAVQN